MSKSYNLIGIIFWSMFFISACVETPTSEIIRESPTTEQDIKSDVKVEEPTKVKEEIVKEEISEPDKSIQPKLYSVNEDIQVDYLTYRVTNAETFTEMGSSIFKKETNGKFVKVYLEITNNAKETKEIFSPRFRIIDNQERKYDRVSDDIFYINDPLEFGKQLQPSLTTSGAIVFELPKDSSDLKLIISGDWLSATEIMVELNNIKNIGKDTTLKEEQNKILEEAMEES